MDNDALDAPVYNSILKNPNLNQYQEANNSDFTSLPCEAFIASSGAGDWRKEDDDFSYKNPLYQSAHVHIKAKPIVTEDDDYRNSDEGEKPFKYCMVLLFIAYSSPHIIDFSLIFIILI